MKGRRKNVIKKKIVAVAITTVALSLGSVGIATAENSKSSAKSKVSIGKFFNQTTSVNLRGRSMEAHGQNLAAILAGLVAKGTLTQAQVDAINAAIVAARSSDQTQGDAARTAHKTLIATTLGISVATLEARMLLVNHWQQLLAPRRMRSSQLLLQMQP